MFLFTHYQRYCQLLELLMGGISVFFSADMAVKDQFPYDIFTKWGLLTICIPKIRLIDLAVLHL